MIPFEKRTFEISELLQSLVWIYKQFQLQCTLSPVLSHFVVSLGKTDTLFHIVSLQLGVSMSTT